MQKKLLTTLLLALVLAIGAALPAWAATSGSCGENATWTYDETTKTLTISGTGVIKSPDGFDYSDKKEVQKLIIEEGIIQISDNTFYGYQAVVEISIPDSVTHIGSRAFSGCSSLTEIDIPARLIRIGDYAFDGCHNLTAINVDPNNPQYASIDGAVFNKEKTELMFCPQGKTAYTVPDSVTGIYGYAFNDCAELLTVSIPDSVTALGQRAFSGCCSLTNINIPAGMTNIADYAFQNCRSLTDIIIPEGSKDIFWNTFDGCSSLTNITIPTSVTRIYSDAFKDCSSLRNITYTGTKEQWAQVNIATGNQELQLATVTCTDGKPVEPEQPTKPEEPTGDVLYGIVVNIDNDNVAIFTQEGGTVTYTMTNAAAGILSKDKLGQLVAYELNTNKKVSSFNFNSQDLLGRGNIIAIKNNAYLVGTRTITVAANAVIFEVSKADGAIDVAIVPRSVLLAGGDFYPGNLNEAGIRAYCKYFSNSDDTVKVLAYTRSSSLIYKYGVIDDYDFKTADKDHAITFYDDDTVYELDITGADAGNDQLAIYTLLGDKVNVKFAYARKDGMKDKAMEVKGFTDGLMSFDTAMVVDEAVAAYTDIMTDKDTVVYLINASTGKYVLGELYDISKGSYVYVPMVDENDNADLVIVDEYTDYDSMSPRQDLVWTKTGTVQLKYGEDKTYVNAAANNSEGGSTPTYTSSKPEVATVDTEGNVTIVGPGRTIISACAEAVENKYRQTVISYTLNVLPHEVTISSVTVADKEYDGNKNAVVQEIKFAGLLDSDVLREGIDYTVNAVFDKVSPGERTVTVTVTMLNKKYSLGSNTLTAKATIKQPTKPIVPESLTLSLENGGLGKRILVEAEAGRWLTIQTSRAGAVVISTVQGNGSGSVTFSAPLGSSVQVWETDDELTFVNGMPTNPILKTAKLDL